MGKQVTAKITEKKFYKLIAILGRQYAQFFYKNNVIRTTRLKFGQKLKTT